MFWLLGKNFLQPYRQLGSYNVLTLSLQDTQWMMLTVRLGSLSLLQACENTPVPELKSQPVPELENPPITRPKIPPIPGLAPSSRLEIPPVPTIENFAPKKPYVSLPPPLFLATSHPSRGSHPLVPFPINLSCEVCCMVGLCGIPLLLTNRTLFPSEMQHLHWGNLPRQRCNDCTEEPLPLEI